MYKMIQRPALFILSVLFFLTSANATVIYVPDQPDRTDIQPAVLAAVNSANNGDIISLPAGIFFFDRNVVVSEFISFRGAGIQNTILYRRDSVPDNTLSNNSDWEGMLKFNINNTASSNLVVSDITFKSKYPSLTPNDGGSLALDYGIIITKCVDFLITRCRFEFFGKGAVRVNSSDTLARGLICNNEFFHNTKGSDGLGWGYGVEMYGDNNTWISSAQFGSDNFIFIENNKFDFHRHAIAAGGAGLFVVRYNSFENNLISHVIHMSDARGGTPGNSNYFSTRAMEVYRNTIINTTFKDGIPIVPGHNANELTERAITVASEALVYDNEISGFRFGCGIITHNFPFSNLYPIPYSIGYLSGLEFDSLHTGADSAHANGDLFYLGNTFSIYPDPYHVSENLHNYNPQYYFLKRDYHTEDKRDYIAYAYPHPRQSIFFQPASINVAIEGYYNAGTDKLNISDTIRIYLRNNFSPWNIIDSAKSVIDSVTMKGSFLFVNAPTGTYYLQVKGRNCIETWSKAGGEHYVYGNVLSYDFNTAHSKALGNNMRQVSTLPMRFGIYSGDVNQDGTVNLNDVLQTYNASQTFATRYVVTDLNGDNIVDLSDVLIANNNSAEFVSVIRP